MTSSVILLVEDDDSIALIVETILHTAGHTVLRAQDGALALKLAQGHSPGFLIADLNLPGGMNGDSVARTLRAIRPGLPVIFMSGDFDDDTPRADLVERAILLPKPFRRAALLAAMEAATGTGE